MNKVDLLGVHLTGMSKVEFEEFVLNRLKMEKKTVISKVNTEFLRRSIKDSHFRKTLNEADINICDGRGVLWAAKYLSLPLKCKQFRYTNCRFFIVAEAVWQMVYSGAAIVLNPKSITYPIQENIAGVDAFRIMLRTAIASNSSVFLFGALPQDLRDSVENIQREFPELKISGYLNGFDYQADKSIDPVKIINNTDAKLLFVPQGSPLQEYWIHDNMSKLKNICVAVGEGGTLAFFSGFYKRAPKWMQRLGLEWFFRLFTKSLTPQSGSRIKRVWEAVPVFIYEVVKWKIDYGTSETK